MKKRLIFLALTFFIFSYTFSQNKDVTKAPNNVIYATGGTFVIINQASLNYDLLLEQKEKGFFKRYYSHFEVGAFHINRVILLSSDFSSGIMANAGFIGLTGKKNNHFEAGLGISVFSELKDTAGGRKDTFISPRISIGYRYQSEKGFIFRVGTGILQGFYTSFGYSF